MIRFILKKRLHTAEGKINLHVEMSLKEGEFGALFGKSGSGKTSILRMLAGLTQPDEGRIDVGQNIWFDSATGINLPPQKRQVGMVFQDYALFPHLSIRDNLRYPLKKRNSEAEIRIDQLLSNFHLQKMENRFPETLSGGQKQRVALARALVVQPQLLLLDEPLSALDAEMRAKLQNEIGETQRQFGVSTLLVSHDMAEIFRLTSKVYWLDQGAIMKTGSPNSVFSRNRFSGKFKFYGILLEKQEDDVLTALTLMVGSEIVKVTALREEAESWEVGDKLLVVSKAFNPLIQRVSNKEFGDL